MIHENFHTKQRVQSARCTHVYITQLYIMLIQPVNKAVEHLIHSTPVLEKRERHRQTETERRRHRQRRRRRRRRSGRKKERKKERKK